MVHYKLYYFGIRARAEATRMLFKAAGQEFEEVNWMLDKWPEFKKQAPFGSAPWLEIDGQKFGQSHAIERYVANKYGLAGKTEFDHLRCDEIVDCLLDLTNKHLLWMFVIKEENAKAAVLKDFLENSLPTSFKILEGLASGGGFLVGDSLTWADIKLFCFLDWVHRQVPTEFLDGYPKLKGVIAAIEKHPALAEHIKNRHPKLTIFD